MRLQSSQGARSVCTLVEKHGGDAFHFSSPEKSTLEILHLLTSNIVKAETLVQLSFSTHALKVRRALQCRWPLAASCSASLQEIHECALGVSPVTSYSGVKKVLQEIMQLETYNGANAPQNLLTES